MIQQVLGGMDAAEFLECYWQKQPCVIRQAIPDFQSFMSRQDLFDLAGREQVESRLVLETAGEYPWQVTHGPFDESDFAELPKTHWSLLVQHTDLHSPAAAAFLNQFRFIPRWRIDDLMISYAPEHGSVGPHLDSYDVFLFQATGRRHWSINRHDYKESDFIDGLDLQIINHFQARQQWWLEPGDMLYLPPGVAHHGVALEAGMGFSVGCRAPSSHELLSHYVDDTLEQENDRRYSDPDLSPQEHSGEITRKDLREIITLFHSALPDETCLVNWFGRYVTRPAENEEPAAAPGPLDPTAFLAYCQNQSVFSKHHATRTAFIRKDQHFILFVNGEACTLSTALAPFIYAFTENDEFDNPLPLQNPPGPELIDLLYRLYNDGIIA